MKRCFRFILFFVLAALSMHPAPAVFATANSSVLNGDAVSPVVLPGEIGSSVVISWTDSLGYDAYAVYAESDGSTPFAEEFSAVHAEFRLATSFKLYSSKRCFIFTAVLPLEPGKSYVYGLSEDGSVPSVLYPIQPADDNSSVLVVADPHLGNAKQTSIMEATIENALEESPANLILCCGDLMDKMDYSQQCVDDSAFALRSVPFVVVCGNHDNFRALCDRYPVPNQNAELGDFYFIRDDVLYIGLHSGPIEFSRQHAQFLRDAVANAGEHRWTVLLIHYSMQSDGSHGVDGPVIHYRTLLAPIISALDIDLVISGHDHEYNRSGLVTSDGYTLPEDILSMKKQPGETVYITVPSSTDYKFYDLSQRLRPVTNFPLAASGLEKESGYVLLDFSRDEILVRAFGNKSGLVDSFTLTHASCK